MIVALLTLAVSFLPDDQNKELSKLIEKFNSKRVDQRIEAITQMGKLYPGLSQDDQKIAAEKLISSVADSSSLVVSAGKVQISENAASINEYLGSYLESDRPRRFNLACETIKAVGPIAKKWTQELAAKLDSSERSLLLGALHALAVLDSEELAPLLDKVIAKLDSKDFNIQLSACRVLAKMGPQAKKAGPRLVELLENGIASSRSWASIALGAIGTHEEYDVVALLSERLDRFYLVDRQRALIGLAYLGKDAKSALPKIEQLMQDESKSVQHTAAQTYWKVTGDSEKAVACLIPLVSKLEIAIEAMGVLEELGPLASDAVPVLIKQIETGESAYREAAIYALASMGPQAKSAIKPLRELKNDKDLLIREAALLAITKIEQPLEKPKKQ